MPGARASNNMIQTRHALKSVLVSETDLENDYCSVWVVDTTVDGGLSIPMYGIVNRQYGVIEQVAPNYPAAKFIMGELYLDYLLGADRKREGGEDELHPAAFMKFRRTPPTAPTTLSG